ncbi:MAG: T9SS type A sorting domain-containing protein [Ignavibacteria bacterium]|nr:T9SS type A sorting domain-containing protein [Ignavibacteria bacterium]
MKKFQTVLFLLSVLFTTEIYSQWSSDSTVNLMVSDLNGDQALPKISLTSDGGCYISWFDNRSGSYAVYLQKLNSSGVKQFQNDGILISGNPQSSSLVDWDMITDNADNAVIVFTDTRNGSSINPFAYRISPSGNFLWGNNGVALAGDAGTYQANPKVIQTSDSNFVITWVYSSSPNKIAFQKLSPAGAKLWGADPVYFEGGASENYTFPSLVRSDNGSVIALWSGYTGPFINPGNYRLYSRKISSGAATVWQDTVYSLGGVLGFFVPKIFSDGNNGALYVWQDDRNLSNLQSSYVQHISSAGVRNFPLNGSEASQSAGNNKFDAWASHMSATGETYLIFRMANSNQSQFAVYGQKLSASGDRQWGNDGREFLPFGQNSMERLLVLTRDTSIVFSFNESIFGSANNQIRYFSSDRNGNIGWGGYIHYLSSVSSEKLRLTGVINSSGMSMLAWSDRRQDGGGIYAQNINSNGSLGNLTGINSNYHETPDGYFLSQNYPNPFNPKTIISYQLSMFNDVTLKVFDVTGNELTTLINESQNPGKYSVEFDGSNFPSGVYFYKLTAGGFEAVRRMILIK